LLEWSTSIERPLCGERIQRWDLLTQREATMKKFTAILLTLCVSVAFSMTFMGCDQGSTGAKTDAKKPDAKTPAASDAKKAP
jgi:hypothetical protein